MSTDDRVLYATANDNTQSNFDYVSSSTDYITINDINALSYPNSWVNFTNLQIQSDGSSRMFDLSNAMLILPYTVALYITPENQLFIDRLGFTVDGTKAAAILFENIYAIACKGAHHLIHSVIAKVYGVNLKGGSVNSNLMINEEMKKLTAEEYALIADFMELTWDNADSYDLEQGIGTKTDFVEVNNYTSNLRGFSVGIATDPTAATTVKSVRGTIQNRFFRNTAQILRTRKNILNRTGVAVADARSIQELVFTPNTADTTATNRCTQMHHSALVFQYTATIPLAKLHSCFEKMPLLSSLSGFELKLQLNIGTGNLWSVVYGTELARQTQLVGTATLNENPVFIREVISNQSVGNTCPFLLSEIGYGANATIRRGTGLAIGLRTSNDAGAANPNFRINCISAIGHCVLNYTDPTNEVQLSTWAPTFGAPSTPCRIQLPSYVLTPDSLQMYISSPKKKVQYTDYYIDVISNRNGGQSISQLISAQLSYARELYIIPFLNSTYRGATSASPLVTQSLVSSAPNTCSLCKLTNFRVSIGGIQILLTPYQYSWEFYHQSVLPMMAKANGNSLKNNLFYSGKTTFNEWMKGPYGVYQFSLKKVLDEVQDQTQKSFILDFRIDMLPVLTYDFYVIITYDNIVYVDVLSSQITNS